MFKRMAADKWIKDIFENNTMPENIIALNFGLFESPKGNMVYCIGSAKYDENDPDWACNKDFIPAEKYFTPKKSISNFDWMKFNSTMCNIIKTAINNNINSIPSSVNNICCGFDDGDLTVLWTKLK